MLELGRLEEAENFSRQAVQILRPILDKDHARLVFNIKFLNGILLARGKWDESEALLKDCIARSPENAEYLSYLGGFYARRGRWADAIPYLRRANSADPQGDFFTQQLCVALLQVGRTNEYLEICRRQLKKYAMTREAGIADKAAKMSLLLPMDGTDIERAGQLADVASATSTPAYVAPWFQLCKSLAELRRGHFDSAVDWSARSLSQTVAQPQCRAAAQFIQAMAQKQIGRAEAARDALSSGKNIIATAKDFTAGDFGDNWQDWFIADFLRREAEALIDGKVAITPPAK